MMRRTVRNYVALMMCVLTVLSAAVFCNVSAAGGVSKIDSYASLVDAYGSGIDSEGRTDGFVYVGTEFYEEDGSLTDYTVSPGDKLTVKLYLKSNMYSGECRLVSFFDNTFFDVKIIDDGAPLDDYGYTSGHKSAPVNGNHPMVSGHNMGHSATSININRAGWIKNLCGFTAEYLSSVDLVDNQSNIDPETADTAYEMTSDEWIFSYYVHVREDLDAGDTGVVDSPEIIWQSSINPATGKHDARKQAQVPVRHKSVGEVSAVDVKKTHLSMDSGELDYFIIDDLYHVFTIGDDVQITDPTDAPEEPTQIPDDPTDGPTDEPTYVYPDDPGTEYPTDPEYPTDSEITTEPSTTVPTTPDSDAGIYIKTPSVTEIPYGDSIILHAVATGVPKGAKIEWSADNNNFAYSWSIDRKTCTIRPRESGITVFTAKVVDENGTVLCEDEVEMKSKAGTLWRIIAFIKQLFGLNKIIPELFKTL